MIRAARRTRSAVRHANSVRTPHAWRRCMTAIAVGCLLATAAAQLDVDAAGGPLTLPEEVAAAFSAWQVAFADELAEPAATFAYAPELAGPTTASLTLRWGDGRTEVLLAPARYRTGPVLLHEIGVLLGLPEVGRGVMDPFLTPDAPNAPTDEDVARLRDLFTYPPADLTRDGSVDFYDLAALGAAYGSVGINLRADLTGDGRVDDEDLAALREAYAFAPPSSTPPAAMNLAPSDGAAEPATDEGDTSSPGGAPTPDAPTPDDGAPGEDREDAGEPGGDNGTEDEDPEADPDSPASDTSDAR